ncbi:hypothetical protein RB614_30510 [Phytohabitans sp. ZYX-F-186]|uniref:Heparin-sulfate lyase N-terminal domain-containing protein n=1 Tax=Phytohabitans maris TaxID=3071409 RepID=A0ABU0ZPI4_9ACTN|nr:hypothetical protein [Phytohabitans sp. ZYX-F-186]MDQ7908873.1 hypothetical protein [Phytohabitans sp. ZYX-F-186]
MNNLERAAHRTAPDRRACRPLQRALQTDPGPARAVLPGTPRRHGLRLIPRPVGLLAGSFWADLEQHHPGIDSLNLSNDVALAWKERTRLTRDRRFPGRERRDRAALFFRVRAFYLDIAEWALEDPYWVQFAAPSPVRRSDTRGLHQDQEAGHRCDAPSGSANVYRNCRAAYWVGADGIWQVGATADRSAVRDYREVLGHAGAHTAVAGLSSGWRLNVVDAHAIGLWR